MIKMYLKRQFFSVGFWAIILVSLAVTFFSRGMGSLTTNIYIIDSIFEEIVNYDTVNYMAVIELYNTYEYFQFIISSSEFYLILPLLTVPFLIQFSDIKNNNFEKGIVSRIGHKKFYCFSIFSLIIISFIASFIIVAIISVIVAMSFPMEIYTASEFWLLALKKCILVSMLTTAFTSLSLLLVIITRNKFLSIVSCVLLMKTFNVTMTRTASINSIFAKPTYFLCFFHSQIQNNQIIYIISPIVATTLILFACYYLLERRRENNE